MTKIRKSSSIAALVFIFFCGVLYSTYAFAMENISVSINSPSNNDTFQLGEVIHFSGEGIIPITTEDGTKEYHLTGSDLVWESSLDGRIGLGTYFATSSLSAGNHRITLIADNEAIASINIEVTASPSGNPVTSGKYATFNMATGILYIPYSPVPGISYWVNMRIKTPLPLTLELTGVGQNTWDPNTQYATFNLVTDTLFIPDFRDTKGYSYWLSLQMSDASELIFKLGGADLN